MEKLGFHISLYLSDEVARQMASFIEKVKDKCSVTRQSPNESKFRFFLRIQKYIDLEHDFVFINTIQGRIIWYFIFWKAKAVPIISNGRLSDWFGRKYQLLGFKNFRDFAHHNYSNFFTRILRKRFKNMIFHTPKALEFASQNGHKHESLVIPFSCAKDLDFSFKSKKQVQITITGSISKKQRDHIQFLRAFKLLGDKEVENIHINLLSRLNCKNKYHQQVLNEVNALRLLGFSVKIFTSWIDDELYDVILLQTDIVVSPIKVNEYYSCGELTSAMVHAIEYSIPAAYPLEYQPDPNLVSSSIYFSDYPDFVKKVKNIIADEGSLKNIKKCAFSNYSKYSTSRSAQLLLDYLKKIN